MLRLPGLGPDSAIAQWVSRVVRFRARSRRVRVATSAATLAAGLGIVAMLVSLQLSSTPTFCGTCHIMKPYYQSWKHSSHNRIACVECHISPGIGAEARKKFEALSMVAKYFTGTYGTKPWAEVDDAACLRCHERRLLQGMVVFQGVQFDHTPHLTEIRRGLHLRCTSCHSQIVQGTHLTVTSSTCALCHFKGQGINQGYGRCRRCHEVPEQVATATGVSFDHSQVSRLDLQCQSCHAGVVRGTGEVAPERCLSCHNQPDRLARFGDRQFLHEWHVTRHKVDCQNCHSLIEHGRLPSTSTIVTAEASGACVACHGSGHNPQQDLYAGSGGRGVPRMPSPMFTAGVTCQGCHDPALAIEPASVEPSGPHSQRAGAVSCMSCHGPSFGAIYQRWKQAVDERTEAMRRQLESSAGAMGLEPPAAWEDARHNFALVSKGKGVHNVGFTYALLDKAHEQMNDARRAKGLAPLPKPWKSLGAGAATCTGCHVDIEKQSGRFGERAFAHAPHVVSAQLACQTCHRPHAERAPGEVVRYGSEGCTSCHHRALPAASPQACGRCHGDVTAHTYPSFRGEFSHRQHLDAGLECTSCHGSSANDPRPRKSQCMQCHD